MSNVIFERSFEGAVVKARYFDCCADGVEESESHFYRGYAEVKITGNGSHPHFLDTHLRIIFAVPKYVPLIFPHQTNDFILVFLEQELTLVDIEIGCASLRGGPEATQHPIIIIDFESRDGEEFKKIVALDHSGHSVEIPNETLQ